MRLRGDSGKCLRLRRDTLDSPTLKAPPRARIGDIAEQKRTNWEAAGAVADLSANAQLDHRKSRSPRAAAADACKSFDKLSLPSIMGCSRR
ncbi:MAG: hypothetical protein P8H90_12370 [Tateyamaria sp.]|nr:hypothetical protein [Tateyamaria sp.]